MAIRKNKKFIDPRYFMDEKMETIEEGIGDTLAGFFGRKKKSPAAAPEAQSPSSPELPADFNIMFKSDHFRKEGNVLPALQEAIEKYDEDYREYLKTRDKDKLKKGIFGRRMKQYFSEMRTDDRMWDLYDIYRYVETKKEADSGFSIK